MKFSMWILSVAAVVGMVVHFCPDNALAQVEVKSDTGDLQRSKFNEMLRQRDVSTVSSAARRLGERVRNSDDLARIKRDLSDKLAILQA
jgi:hypothetical protein